MACDLDRISRKLFAQRGTLHDLVVLYQFVRQLPRLIHTLRTRADECDAVGARFTEPLAEVNERFDRFVALVEQSIDLEAVSRGEYAVQPRFEAALVELHAVREEKRALIVEHHSRLRRKLRLDEKARRLPNVTATFLMWQVLRSSTRDTVLVWQVLKLETDPRFGYVLRVTRKDEKEIRNLDGINRLQTKKDGVIFRDAPMEELVADYSALSSKYDKASKALVVKVVETAATFCPVIQQAHALVAELDVLLCFAQVLRVVVVVVVVVTGGAAVVVARRAPPLRTGLNERAKAVRAPDARRARRRAPAHRAQGLPPSVRRGDGRHELHQERRAPRARQQLAPDRHGSEYGR